MAIRVPATVDAPGMHWAASTLEIRYPELEVAGHHVSGILHLQFPPPQEAHAEEPQNSFSADTYSTVIIKGWPSGSVEGSEVTTLTRASVGAGIASTEVVLDDVDRWGELYRVTVRLTPEGTNALRGGGQLQVIDHFR